MITINSIITDLAIIIIVPIIRECSYHALYISRKLIIFFFFSGFDEDMNTSLMNATTVMSS